MSKTKIARAAKNTGKGVLLPIGVAATGGVAANQFPQNRKSSKKMVHEIGKRYADFNYAVAERMFDLVMKMDDDSALMFAEILISDASEEMIEKNLPIYQKHLDKVISKRIKETKRALLASISKSNGEEAKAYAETLVQIEKADWDQKLHPRAATGRFTFKVKHVQTKPLRDEVARSLGVGGLEKDEYKSLPAAQKAQYQDEYRQISQFLDHVKAAVGEGNFTTIYHIEDDAGNRWTETGKIPRKTLLESDTRLVGIEAHPEALTYGGAAFNLNGALSPTGMKMINAGEQNLNSFSSHWLGAGNTTDQNQKLYDRSAASAQMLTALGAASGNPKLLAAGKVAEFVGSHGHEAEAVIGPTARKTAYRYRGTEKTPDASMIRDYERAVTDAKSNTRRAGELSRTHEKGSENVPVQRMATGRAQDASRKPSFEEIRQGSQAVVNHLRDNMPDRKLYNLQLASGNTPPSEGVIINRNGQIVTQAIGYGDDHYLPFNLKNLKGLKGGEYIRTRSVGGPTSEDIYTGLIAGARRITVVSRSGTFTITFEDDFRGARRHNDKARRMTRRYEQILDAVQSEQVDNQTIPTEVRRKIVEEAQKEAKDFDESPVVTQKKIQTKINEYKSNTDLTPDEEQNLDQRVAAAAVGARNDREVASIRAQLYGAALARKEYKYKLNGPGYQAALKALEEQFPYYIKTDSKPMYDLESYSSAKDKGYVEPGRNRPTEALAGLYGTKDRLGALGNEGAKFSASTADFQGTKGTKTKVGPLTRVSPGSEEPAEEAEGGETPEGKEDGGKAQGNAIRNKIARRTAIANVQKELKEKYEARNSDGERLLDLDEKQAAVLELTPDEIVKDENLGKFDKLVRAYNKNGGKLPPEVRMAYEKAMGHHNREAYNRESPVWAAKPADFDKGAGPYSENATYEQRLSEMKKRDGASALQDKRFSAMSVTEQEAEHDLLLGLLEHAKAHPKDPISADLKRDYGAAPGAPGNQGLNDVATIRQRLENLHRMRALMADLSPEEQSKARHSLEPGMMVLEGAAPTSEEQAKGWVGKRDSLLEEIRSAVGTLREGSEDDQNWADILEDWGADLEATTFKSDDAYDTYVASRQSLMDRMMRHNWEKKQL